MLHFKRVARGNPERIFVQVFNSTGAVLSQGHPVCWATRNIASANGVDIDNPATSNMAVFTGVVEGAGSNFIGTQGYGLVQVYGYHPASYLRIESNENGGKEGQNFSITAGKKYFVSARPNTINGIIHFTGQITLMSRLAAGTFEAQAPCFIRAL